jgi:hypothetical protein
MFTTVRSNHDAAIIRVGLIIAVLAAGGSRPLSAQQANAPNQAAPLRNGFHFSIGLGSASVSASCAECDIDFFDNRLNGLSGNIQLGGAATSRLVIAAEFSGWMKNDEPIYRRIAALNLVVLGYPSETSGFFIKGAVGGLRAIAENDFIRLQTDALTAQTGVGFDITLGSIMLTPYVNYVRTFNAETYFNGVVSPVAVLPNAIQFGSALTIH